MGEGTLSACGAARHGTQHRKTPSATATALLATCLAICACLTISALPEPAHAAEGGASTTIYAKYYENPDEKLRCEYYDEDSDESVTEEHSAYTLVIQGDDTDRSGEYGKLDETQGGMVGPRIFDKGPDWYVRGWKSEDADGFVTRVVIADEVRPADTHEWFAGLGECRSVEGLGKLDTSGVGDMAGMFAWCTALESIDLSGLDTSNATDMSYMFASCVSLKAIDMSALDMSKTANARGMFSYCESLGAVDLSGKDLPEIEDTSEMFYKCSSLKECDLSDIDALRLKTVKEMFRGCSKLAEVGLAGFRAPSLEDANSLFHDCELLRAADLSDIGAFGLSDVEFMFSGCTSLASVDLSGIGVDEEGETLCMIDECDSLNAITIGDKLGSQILFPSEDASYEPVAWRNERGEVFSYDEVPDNVAAVYTRVPAADDTLISIDDAEVSLAFTSKVYTGTPIRPAATVKLGGKKLKAGRDYAVEYCDNRVVGNAEVHVTGRGTYSGEAYASFEIRPKGVTSVKVSRSGRGFTVKWAKRTSQTTGYQVRWSTSKSMKNAKSRTVKSTGTTSLKVSDLKAGKKYYVQVRTYTKVYFTYGLGIVDYRNHYSMWSSSKTVTTGR